MNFVITLPRSSVSSHPAMPSIKRLALAHTSSHLHTSPRVSKVDIQYEGYRSRVSVHRVIRGSELTASQTGSATGFIGFPVAQALARAGHIVYGLTRSEANTNKLAAEESEHASLPQLNSNSDSSCITSSNLHHRRTDVHVLAPPHRETRCRHRVHRRLSRPRHGIQYYSEGRH